MIQTLAYLVKFRDWPCLGIGAVAGLLLALGVLHVTVADPAFALTAAADRTEDPVLIENVGMALRNSVFEQGLDIGRPEVVSAVADRFGLTPLDADATEAAVRADWEEGKRRGVVGSPHFFTPGGGNWFCPGLAISRDDAGAFVVAWKEGSDAFVDSVFSKGADD